MELTDLQNRFDYHPPLTDECRHAHEAVRALFGTLAVQLNQILPEGREKSLTVTQLEQGMYWANAAIARQR